MINPNAEIIEDRIFKQAWSAARVANRNPVLVGSIDALILPFGDEHPQVTRDGDEGYLSLIGSQDGDDHRVRAEGAAGSSIGADQQEVDSLLSVVQDLTTARSGRVNCCQRCKGIEEDVRVDGRGFGLSGRGESRGWGSRIQWSAQTVSPLMGKACQSESREWVGRELQSEKRSAQQSPIQMARLVAH